jgi:hypothetical protein
MIDGNDTQLRPLSHLARNIPNRRGGNGINVATLWRWSQAGVKGIKLRCTMVGGIKMASEADVAAFFAALTAQANGEPAPIRTTRQREAAIRAAKKELTN